MEIQQALYRRGEGLVTNYGDGGQACEVLPLRKGRAEKVLAILKGGGGGGQKQFWGRFYAAA